MGSYKYGFKTLLNSNYLKGGLNKNLIHFLTKKNKNSYYILNFRKNSLNIMTTLKQPDWCFFELPVINYNKLCYFSKLILKKTNNVKIELNDIFIKLGLIKKNITNTVIDLIFDSNSIYFTMKDFLEKQGIIYLSMFKAIIYYNKILFYYLNSVVSITDNFFSTLNSAVFSEGSFCFIPKETYCIFELTTYFRTNTENLAQFERTLVILEDNSYVSYLEGCTAPLFKESQLHVAIVELIVKKNSILKYSTIQNWYRGTNLGESGVYNLTTKRGICFKNSILNWIQIEIGSFITWKYPCTLLLGENSFSEFYSIAFLSNLQKADTGCKMIHKSSFSKSKVISKSISLNYSNSIYRGLIDIGVNSYYSKSNIECNSLLIGSNSLTVTIPYIKLKNYFSFLEQEALISKINILQLFFFLQRGIKIKLAMTILISGFCENICFYLPIEFSMEVFYLIFLRSSESIG